MRSEALKTLPATGLNNNKINVLADVTAEQAVILSDEALIFLGGLEQRFGERRRLLVAERAKRQARLDAGTEKLCFPAATAHIRSSEWKVRPAPKDLRDRRVEITGPVSAKMVINALNSGAKCFMADFEDSSAPTWQMMIEGQVNMASAVRRTLTHTDAASGKSYTLNETLATLIVRPRGWHLEEAHLQLGGAPISASLMDFGLYLFHNAHELLRRGSGPYFYLPKLENRHEAQLWADAIDYAQEVLGLAKGTIRATILIETLPAAFEMEEILYVLRDNIVGLNCGRWDYIFSMIKTLGRRSDFILPDRSQVTMASPALAAYSRKLISVCHKRGAHAMGGMAAQIPVKGDETANEAAFAKVRADKEREAKNGHDGTWVAHPGLIPVALEAFNAEMPQANQLDKQVPDDVTEVQLTLCPQGTITETGLRDNIRIGVQYIEAWLGGLGCVPLYNLMEDAATAEISRMQIWQWCLHAVTLDSGATLTRAKLPAIIEDEMKLLALELGEQFTQGHFDKAASLFVELCLSDDPAPFLTLPAYDLIK